jgi:hypothetical protein
VCKTWREDREAARVLRWPEKTKRIILFQFGDGSMMPNFGQDFGPQGVHFEDPQFQQDKDIISR